MFTARSSRFVSAAAVLASAAALTSSATARPIFIHIDGVDGECSANSDLSLTQVGGEPVVLWQTPSGQADVVFRPSSQNAGQPMESISFNFARPGAATVPVGATLEVADDVIVDGRIITAAVWARWSKSGPDTVQVEFGKSTAIAGQIEVIVKRSGSPVAVNTCGGDAAGCWILSALCPDLECSIMCPELCGVPAVGRTDPRGGVAVDLPLGGLTTLALPGGATIIGDEVSVVLRPDTAGPQPRLGGVRIAVGDVNGLQFDSIVARFACPADINGSGSLTAQDIFDFLAAYFAATPIGDFNKDSAHSVQDVFDFLAAYFRGC